MTLIFDNKRIQKLVSEYQCTEDPVVLAQIMEGTQSLVQAIVSKYDWAYRDELIQEANAKVIKSLKYYKEGVGTLHNWFTTVIRNTCSTYCQAQYKHDLRQVELLETTSFYDKPAEDDLYEELIERNRQRFPSIPVDIIDTATDIIISHLERKEYSPSVVNRLMGDIGLSRNEARIIYESTLIWLRLRYITNASMDVTIEEYSIHTDLKEILGVRLHTKLRIVLAGMTVKF